MLSEDELKSVPVLVFANKQDVKGALSPGEISDKLGLAGQEKGREWSVRGSCAIKGEGLEEGLDWYVDDDDDTTAIGCSDFPRSGRRERSVGY
jgi:ADP-ribosylation factor-like protein 1